MTNPSPEPHPENLTPFKKGDPATVESARKGAKNSNEEQIRKRNMREWAEYYGSLPLHKGRLKEAKNGDKIKEANPTFDGAVLATAYAKAMKGDVRAMQFIATLKGQFQEEIAVHTDPLANLTEDQLDAIIGAIREARKSDE